MNGLSLCAGCGSLDLGVELAFPEYRCIAAVEKDPQAARRFKVRYPAAKVFRDVVGFDGRPWRGALDCVVAGWPCQPHSVAGRRKGTADARWIWRDIARILDECGTPWFFGENVVGLLRDADRPADRYVGLDDATGHAVGGMGEVLRDLAAMGFDAVWGSLRASDVGAKHGRPRVFFLARRSVADAAHAEWRQEARPGDDHAQGHGCEWREEDGGPVEPSGILEAPAPGPNDPRWASILRESPYLAPALSPAEIYLDAALQQARALQGRQVGEGVDFSPEVESELHRLANELAHRVERWLRERRPRLACCGNGVVPLQSAAAFMELARRLGAMEQMNAA